MPHEVHASIQVALPVEGEKAVAMIGGIASAWAALLAAVTASGADPGHCAQTFTVNESRKARSAIVTARAPRKRTAPTEATPELPV